ncbi:putative duf2418 domain containing protein [Erysiphe neolycopersici]|uniref:Putative duf2418 domain containing protein n=1 Tax=Erysiphe neolycopersici TaxID=212602 RepID=A0A420I3S9_9PEZI|nr:putative duf2418 domain containing protein [Erysiphe neolycopersici]
MPNILNGRLPHPLISYCLQVLNDQLKYLEKHVVCYWDTPKNGNIAALTSHFLYLFARANLKSSKESQNHVFAIKPAKSKLINYTALFIINMLSAFSILNAIYTFSRIKQYGINNKSIYNTKATWSAQHVKLKSLPKSPWRPCNFSNLFRKPRTESRTDQGSLHGTCEIVIWDPILLCLRIFCLFSPGHVLIYSLFYPGNAPETQPGLDIVKVIFLQLLMSIQLYLLETHFNQRAKDLSIINANVMNEYNVKYVYPRLNTIVRDFGTQCAYMIANNDPFLNEDNIISTSSFKYQKSATISHYLDYDNISTLTYQSPTVTKPSSSNVEAVSSCKIQSPFKNQIVQQNITDIPDYSSTDILSPHLNHDQPTNPTNSYEQDRKNFLSRRKYERGPSFFL